MDSAPRNYGGGADTNHLDRAMKEKRPIPEIDFTMHMMEDGTQVSTEERVCKGWSTAIIVALKSITLTS